MQSYAAMALFSSLREVLQPSSTISSVSIDDIRFPTSQGSHGSDAVHKDPDYSCAYVVIAVSGVNEQGHGLTFTLGRGTEVVVAAIKALEPLLVGQSLLKVYTEFGRFWHSLTNESQLRWIGPEKGVVHLATAAIVNALWDLWGKLEGKPVWKLLVDMTPEEVISLVDFTHLSDTLTEKDALEILSRNVSTRSSREEQLRKSGYPCYITSIGWLGYSDDRVKELCREALGEGFKKFKMKVGLDVEDDARRAGIIRNEIGWEYPLMMDANQVWEVDTAITHMTRLAKFKPLFIEEPTSCDDILGHAKIREELKQFNIGVATGEMCQNKVMFKQFLSAGAMDYCQIDSCRLGGVNEIIAVLLMAAKLNVPVCPHAGGVGLCQYVQHLAMFDFISVSGTLERRMIEYANHLHEHFIDPLVIRAGCYYPPDRPGYSEMKRESIEQYKHVK